jgi:hypothetical protein
VRVCFDLNFVTSRLGVEDVTQADWREADD